ncbi:MAG: tetratricopeptide repeat protein [Candidatus Electrothrix sp. AR4]|nr:tetratricopeptide repeat protein [Candidatus Electrothrix sp. AR4]
MWGGAKADGKRGSHSWYLSRSNLGDQLFYSGQPDQAEAVFQETLDGLGEGLNYDRCISLHMLGRCHEVQGRWSVAEKLYQQALSELVILEQDNLVKKETANVQTDLAALLTDRGDYSLAEELYQASLEFAKELGDLRAMAITNGLLGSLALAKKELIKAGKLYKKSLTISRRLGEPDHEAVALHQLGRVYQEAGNWQAAEQAYREAARLRENSGSVREAGASWNQLGVVCRFTERLGEAETWYHKSLSIRRKIGDFVGMARTLTNLADLLIKDPARLDEACLLAEESLEIDKIHPASAEIWKNYSILADITVRQGESSQAALYRAKARQAYAEFPGAQQQVQQKYGWLIAKTLQTVADPAQRDELEQNMEKGIRMGRGNLVAAIRCLLDGERDKNTLCEPLGWAEAAVIRAILEGTTEGV